MKIKFTLLIDDGNQYYKGYPGIFLVDYADMLGWSDERDDLFWEKVSQHYCSHLEFQFTFNAELSSKITDIEKMIAEQIGFDQKLYFSFEKRVYVLLDGEFIYIKNPSMRVLALSKYYHLGETLPFFLVFSNQAGKIWREDGLRYHMHSKEAGRHNEPHIHVDYKHDSSVSICLYDGKVLDGHIPSKLLKKATKKVLENRLFLLECWNKLTDGLEVDINQYFKNTPLDF